MPKLARYIFAVDSDGSVHAKRVVLVKAFGDFPDVHYQTLPASRAPRWVQVAIRQLESVTRSELERKGKHG